MKLVGLITILFLSNLSLGCGCSTASLIDTTNLTDSTKEVFVGKILSIEDAGFKEFPTYIVTVKVKTNFTLKGKEKIIQIWTPATSGACGVEFIQGVDFLITCYSAGVRSTERHANFCLRNVPVKEAAKDIELIRSVMKNRT